MQRIVIVVAFLLVSALAGLGVGVLAMGSIPDSDGTVHGCYGVQGQLRVVSDAGKCKDNETVLSWNQPQQSAAIASQVIGGENQLVSEIVPPAPRLFGLFGDGRTDDLNFTAGIRQIVPVAGVVSDFYGEINIPPGGGTRIVVVEKNTVVTSLGCTFAETDTQCSDLSDTVCFDVGDQAAMFSDIATGASGGVVNNASLTWTALFTPIPGACPP